MSSQPQASPPRQPNTKVDFVPYAAGAAAVVALGYWNPQFLLKAFIFLAILGVLVFVHEWGHYQFALWGGMKVNRFGIGFPPWIFTVRRNNIDYSIGALPIGGMVDISGLGSEEEMVHTAQGNEAPANQRNPDAPFGQRNFQDASLFARFWALFAGPLMNFIYAIVVFVLVFSLAGLPSVTQLPVVGGVPPTGAAAKAGIKAGDTIVALDGKSVSSWTEVVKTIRGNTGSTLKVTVKRPDGAEKVIPVKPEMVREEDGKMVPRAGIEVDTSKLGNVTYEKLSPQQAVVAGFSASLNIATNILAVIKRAVTGTLPPEEAKGIGGPVMIAQTVGQVSEFGWVYTIFFSGMLSVNLGLMNLLPLPALDGGRILFLVYELVARRPFDPRKEGLVHMAGMVMLLTFILLITVKDVSQLPGVSAFFKNFGG